jgi:hypothetical protein
MVNSVTKWGFLIKTEAEENWGGEIGHHGTRGTHGTELTALETSRVFAGAVFSVGSVV